jgi:hypothetical protein
LAKGDINGDGLEDFFVGGASRQNGCFYIQQKSGNFKSQVLKQTSKLQEDLASVLVDTDKDGDLDLLWQVEVPSILGAIKVRYNYF